jgi:hypothetical protein
MRRRTVVAAAAAAAVLVMAAGALAEPHPAQPPPAAPPAVPPAEVLAEPPGPGIQVGPPLPADQGAGAPGGKFDVGGKDRPAWWDVPGRIQYGITGWFRSLVEDALNPMLDLVGKTVLATPQIAGQDRVADLWLI